MSTHNVTNSVLHTSHLVLRPLESSDGDSLFTLSVQPEVACFLWDGESPSREQVESVLEAVLQAQRGGVPHWAIEYAGEFVGHCGLRFAEQQSHLELIFALDPKVWNRGLATEAASAVLHYGIHNLGLDYIIGQANPRNIASWRVLEKTGLSFIKEVVLNGEPLKLYAITRGEYLKNDDTSSVT